jgi:hypothetical protein
MRGRRLTQEKKKRIEKNHVYMDFRASKMLLDIRHVTRRCLEWQHPLFAIERFCRPMANVRYLKFDGSCNHKMARHEVYAARDD